MAQQTPCPVSLREAVETVIQQNRSIGYRPTRFIQMTEGGNADNLPEICDRLIQNVETYNAVSSQLNRHPDILTLEDLIVHSTHGGDWGLDEMTVDTAKARVEGWDKEAGHRRWYHLPGTETEAV